ncbi:MAG: threonine synthase [Beijerinckiaceae bacterium]|nr:threonine synthase [Beijerinckiaceae bacterium]
MRYVSTRGDAPILDFSGVLLAGLAHDGGLYMPESWPQIEAATIAGFAGRPFHEVAVEILKPFVAGSIPDGVLEEAARAAYASFGHPAVTPLVQIGENRFALELFHGPTLAFKDVAMQLIARLIDHVLLERRERATIVCATSGDTGGAAAEAFRGLSSVDLVILFPDGRVSNVQRRMMTTPVEDNVHALVVDGHFDDCQALVKGLFNHHAFRDRVRLAGVNSINWGRIVAQVTYYFVAAAALGAPHRPVSFVVPTGNFGDIFAGYVARRMGLPIERLIVATNQNDILARTLKTGVYEIRSVETTMSPSMDIQVSSNFERLLFEACGRDADAVRGMMASLKQSGRFEVPAEALAFIRDGFDAERAGEDEVADAMRETLDRAGYLAEPHTATAIVAAETSGFAAGVPVIMLATAHPAKFPEAIKAVLGRDAALPPRLAHLLVDAERQVPVANDLAAIERYILANAGPETGLDAA